jgi:hypothetical protein
MLINIILGIAFMYLNDWGIDVVTRSIHDNTESVKEMFEVRSVGYEFDRRQFKDSRDAQPSLERFQMRRCEHIFVLNNRQNTKSVTLCN